MIKFSSTGSFSKAQERIVEIGNQIVYGASMEAVAKKESNGFKSATGGIHDWTTKGSLVHPSLNDAIFSLPTGVLSDVIETSDGLHIIRVIERTDAGAKPFRDARLHVQITLTLTLIVQTTLALIVHQDEFLGFLVRQPIDIGNELFAVYDQSRIR